MAQTAASADEQFVVESSNRCVRASQPAARGAEEEEGAGSGGPGGRGGGCGSAQAAQAGRVGTLGTAGRHRARGCGRGFVPRAAAASHGGGGRLDRSVRANRRGGRQALTPVAPAAAPAAAFVSSAAQSPGISPAGRSRRSRSQPSWQTPDAAGVGSTSVVETVELYSGDEEDEDEDEEGGALVDSANKASGGRGKARALGSDGRQGNTSPPMRGPAPVPLAAMISSDEEDEEGEEAEAGTASQPVTTRIVAPKRSEPYVPPPSVVEIAATQPVEDLAPRAREVQRHAQPFATAAAAPTTAHRAAPAVAPPKLAPAPVAVDNDDDWDSSDSDEEDEMALPPSRRPQPEQQPRAVVTAAVTAPAPAPVRHAEVPAASPAAPPAAPAVFSAPGIKADEDFADEDWDDDE